MEVTEVTDEMIDRAYKKVGNYCGRHTIKEILHAALEIEDPTEHTCPECGHAWEEHEFGVPRPYCP